MLRLILFMLVLLGSGSINAAIFCVSNSAELVTALTTASTNGEGDEIRLKAGDYLPPVETGFHVSLSQNAESLNISGGWFDGLGLNCFNQAGNPRASRIVGNQTHRLLRVTSSSTFQSGTLNIRNLTFRGGRGLDNEVRGAVHLGTPANELRVLFDRVEFIDNSAHAGAALTALNMRRLTIRNSLFLLNEVRAQQGTVFVSLNRDDQRFFFVNNTMIENEHAGVQATRCSGLWVSTPQANTSPDVLIANSIFWRNDDFDACMPPIGDSYLLNNTIEDQFRNASVESGNLSVNPGLPLLFSGITPENYDPTPAPTSAMIDAGLPEPPGLLDPPLPIDQDWSYGNHGFHNLITPRVIGERVDIGAAESTFVDRIHCDAFQLEADCVE